MSDIQRWRTFKHDAYTPAMVANPEGDFVTYADHVEAVKQAEAKERELWNTAAYNDGYERGQRDALAAAVQRVEAVKAQVEWGDKPRVYLHEVIAAIKGDNDA